MNQASVDRHGQLACYLMENAFPGWLTTLFSPQHGFAGKQQANMIESRDSYHIELGLPVYSLYSDTRRPTEKMLRDIDCLVIDLQDVGTRVYTYIWTISYCLEACQQASLPVIILDRVNPIGGLQVEGPCLELDYASFVGRAAVPMRHALTIGELACWVNREMQIGANLEVIPVQGWERSRMFDQTGLPWIAPSPNLPSWENCLVYPGQVVLEATNISEGRGTDQPFRQFGAPFIQAASLLEQLSKLELPGVSWSPTTFQPTFDKWTGEACHGLVLQVTDPVAFRPYRTTLALIAEVARLWPDDFAWISPPYEYEMEKMPVDIVTGSDALRKAVSAGSVIADLDRLATGDQAAWWEQTASIRIYD
ncbi:MAG: DUF1343 domain-containing protein [Planctomycetaceae bacterium]|nr:DUF1343 domain-containing protein [Planctomycetaceae bacterium]